MKINRGDVWYVEKKNDTTGHEQWSGRPAVVVSSEEANRDGTVEVVYLTTKPKPHRETHVAVFACNKFSTAICEQISTVDKRRLQRKNGKVCKGEMERIERAIAISLGISPVEAEEKETLQEQKSETEFWKLKYETAMECYTRALETMK